MVFVLQKKICKQLKKYVHLQTVKKLIMNFFIRNYFSKAISQSKRIQKTLRPIDVFNMHQIIFKSKSHQKVDGVYVLSGEALQAQNILVEYYFESFINKYINSYASLDDVFEAVPLFMKAVQEFDPDKGFKFSTFLQHTLKTFKVKRKDAEINLGTVIPRIQRAVFDAHNKHYLLNGEEVPGEFLIEDEAMLESIKKYKDKILRVTTSIDNPVTVGDEEENFTLQDMIGIDDDDVELEDESTIYRSKYNSDIIFINKIYDGLIEATVSTDKLNLKRRKSMFNAMISSKKLHETFSLLKTDSKLLNDVTARAINDCIPDELRYEFNQNNPRLFKENIRHALNQMFTEIKEFLSY